ncbi:uncharacterized protein AKAME5_002570100, partial [Lates japonicus]
MEEKVCIFLLVLFFSHQVVTGNHHVSCPTPPIEAEEGAEENKRVGAIVGGVLGALFALVLILIGVLVKRGKLQIRKKTPNTFELEKLRTRATEGDDHLNRASGNGSGNLLHEVLINRLKLGFARSRFLSGNYHVFCPTQQIKEQKGGVAKLQCHVDPSVNLEDYILYCTRADLNDEAVASLRYGKFDADPQMDQYRNTTTLTYDPISRNLTLLIFPLTLFHSGQYRCLAPKLTDSGTITLTV